MSSDELITAEQMVEVDEAIRRGSHRKRALRAAGISQGDYRKILRMASEGINPYHDFVLGMEQAEASAENALVTKLGAAKDWRAAAFILERRYPEEWGQKIQVEVQKELEKVFTVAEEILTEEQFIRLLESISRLDSQGEASEAKEASAVH